MCAVAVLGVVASLAATAVTVYSQQKSGQYNEEVEKNNAKIAGWQKADALRRGANESSAIRQQGRMIGAKALAGMGASGVETTVGSPSNIFATSSINTELDAETAKANAAREAWGFQNESQDRRAKAGMIRNQSLLGSIGSGIQGAGSFAGGMYDALK
jgi:hypothetical protein